MIKRKMVFSKRLITLFVFFSLCLLNTSFSQKREDIIGEWKIIKVELTANAEPAEKEGLGLISKLFLKSVFHFRDNNTFSFSCPDPEMNIKDAVWQYDEGKKSIRVVNGKTTGRPSILMEIIVGQKNEDLKFLMEETPVILTIRKK